MKARAREAWNHFERLALSWWGQFAALMILLGKMVWGMWKWRDLTCGDTANYFGTALRHLSGEPLDLVYSPLYQAFFSGFVAHFGDAYAATILHRIVILVLLGTSLLLLSRALLPRPVAWLVAAWWVVLPITWNALYEVHLFGFIPLALGCWMVGGRPRRWSLAGGLALVWSGALLVRNEYALAVALLAACGVIREFVIRRRTAGRRSELAARIFVLALPSILIFAVAVAAWHGSWPGWKMLRDQFHERHTTNMAQVYPFSYQQRHPEWTKNPWTGGSPLMEEYFGKSLVTFTEAFRHNPGAIVDYSLWHFQLLPAGLQLGVFNCRSGAVSPDFTPPRQKPVKAAVLSVALLALFGAGVMCLWRRRAFFGRYFRSRHGWPWLALLCMLPACFVAIAPGRATFTR